MTYVMIGHELLGFRRNGVAGLFGARYVYNMLRWIVGEGIPNFLRYYPNLDRDFSSRLAAVRFDSFSPPTKEDLKKLDSLARDISYHDTQIFTVMFGEHYKEVAQAAGYVIREHLVPMLEILGDANASTELTTLAEDLLAYPA